MNRQKESFTGPVRFLVFPLLLFITSGCGNTNQRSDAGHNSAGQSHMQIQWSIDPVPILTRSEGKGYDSRVVGDPCIIWDQEIENWRMFYFAGGYTDQGDRRVGTGMALSKSPELIGPGDWKKIGPVEIENEEGFMNPFGWHKWWVVMDGTRNNHAALIKGKYWAVFTCTVKTDPDKGGNKHIQVASSPSLSGPWYVNPVPVLSPDEDWFDGRHCDTPTAYYFEDKNEVAIFYKAYPKFEQDEQPGSRFGSGTVLATWHPDREKAKKIKIIQRPGQMKAWNQGWMSTPQIFYDEKNKNWYGLINGSPTAPEDDSHREPAPSLGGWVLCNPGKWLDGEWGPDSLNSPFLYPQDLTREQLEAGLGVNFWRHHLMVTPDGKKRIFFNSGPYGKEQMYSLVPEN